MAAYPSWGQLTARQRQLAMAGWRRRRNQPPPGLSRIPGFMAPPAPSNVPVLQGDQIPRQTPGQRAAWVAQQNAAHPNNQVNDTSPSGQASSAGGGAAARPFAPLVDDAQAAAARAQALFDRTQQISQLNQQSAYDRGDLEEAMRRMGMQRPLVEQQTRENANRSGLLFSGILGKRLGDVATDYARREGDARSGFDRRESDRSTRRRAAEQQAVLLNEAITQALVDRQTQRDAETAAAGALVAPAADASPPDTSSGAGAGQQQQTPSGRQTTKARTAAQMRAANPAMVQRVKQRMLEQRRARRRN